MLLNQNQFIAVHIIIDKAIICFSYTTAILPVP